jgi:hypothetical protein
LPSTAPRRSARRRWSAGASPRGSKSSPGHEIAGLTATSPRPNRASGPCASHCSPCFRAPGRLLLAGQRPRSDTHRAAPCGSAATETGHHGRKSCRDGDNARDFVVWPWFPRPTQRSPAQLANTCLDHLDLPHRS